ncbi:mucin-20 isoform 2-T2 [Trichechus inunguis]
MGSLWGLALPLFLFCWEAGVPGSSAGPSTSRPDLLVTTNHTGTSAVTAGVRTSLEGAFQTSDVAEASGHIPLETQALRTETTAGTFIPGGTTSEVETRDIKTISPATETKALSRTIPYHFMAVITNPVETSATSGGTTVTEMTTAETVTGSDLTEAIFDTLRADDSSEEVKMVIADMSTLARASAEAGVLTMESSASSDISLPMESSASSDISLPMESSASSDISLPIITISSALEPEITTPAKAWVAYTIADIEATNSSVTEIQKTATIPGLSDTSHSPTRAEAQSTIEISALPDSTEAKSHITKTTISVKILSIASTTESATPGTTVEPLLATNNTKEGETTVKATTPNGTLVTVSTHSLKETAAFSVETVSHTKVSEVESTMGKTTTPAMISATVHSPSEVATKNSTLSETFTTDSTTSRNFPISRDPLPSVNLTTTSSSQAANITLAKTTASAKTLMIASTTRGKPPTAIPTTAETRLTTKGTAGGDGGFLLLRLSVASPEDFTDPRVAERLMKQLRHELHAHMLPIQVSLLRVRRS